MAVSKEEKDRIDLAIAAGAMAMAAKKAKSDSRRDAPGAGSRVGDGGHRPPGQILKRAWKKWGKGKSLIGWLGKMGVAKVRRSQTTAGGGSRKGRWVVRGTGETCDRTYKAKGMTPVTRAQALEVLRTGKPI